MVVRNYKELLKNITTLIFDYDGVFTEGKILLLENGDQMDHLYGILVFELNPLL